MGCANYVYSDEYADFLVDYNYDISEIDRRFDPDCTNILSEKYAIIHKKIDDFDKMEINRYGYSSFPKIYSKLDETAIESIGVNKLRRIEGFDYTGRDVLVGFVDTGINYTLDIFKREDGISRILGIWDQSIYEEESNSFFGYGRYYTEEEINRAIKSDNPYEYVKQMDMDGHGTELASLAAGGIDEKNEFTGVAIDSDIVVVKLREAKNSLKDYYGIEENISCYQDTDIFAGVLFLKEIAKRMNKPLVICIGVGTNQGGHDGRSYLGELLDFLSSSPGIAVVVAGGNEVTFKHHYKGEIMLDEGEIVNNKNIDDVEINVGANVKGFYLELWTKEPNIVGIGLISPTGEVIPMVSYSNNNSEEVFFLFDNTRVYIDYINDVPNSGNALVFVRFKNPSEGVWTIQVYKESIIEGRYDIWLPIRGLISKRLEIIDSDADTTLSSIANASYVITVSGYNHNLDSLYVNSSRGYTFDDRIKPDLSAPSVDIYTLNNRGNYINMTGTSAGAALTSGVVAMLFEWGIINDNYREMDGIIAKKFLIRGALEEDSRVYPNKEWGYGKLNIYESFNRLRN